MHLTKLAKRDLHLKSCRTGLACPAGSRMIRKEWRGCMVDTGSTWLLIEGAGASFALLCLSYREGIDAPAAFDRVLLQKFRGVQQKPLLHIHDQLVPNDV